MENLVFTQLSISEVRSLFRQELQSFFAEKQPPAPVPDGEKFLSVKETSEYLQVAIPTIYEWTSQGKIPFFKQGKKLYFSRAELAAWIESGRRKTSAEIASDAAKLGK